MELVKLNITPDEVTPDEMAIRDALWRALHVHEDPSPHIFTDEIGEKLVGQTSWRQRWDMNPEFTKNMRALTVVRARFIEDLVLQEISKGVSQYVILGAGLDTFAQRRKDTASRIDIFEIDRPAQQEWKKRRLNELGFHPGPKHHFVPVDLTVDPLGLGELIKAGFDSSKPAIIITGGSMFHTKEENQSIMNQIVQLAPGSTFGMSFFISPERLKISELAMTMFITRRAQEMGKTFFSLFCPDEVLKMAESAGLKRPRYMPASMIHQLLFLDNFNIGAVEGFLVAHT